MSIKLHVGIYWDNRNDDDALNRDARMQRLFSMVFSEVLTPGIEYHPYIHADGVTRMDELTASTDQPQEVVETAFNDDYYEGVWDYLYFEEVPTTWSSDATIKTNGDSLIIRVTDACRELGLTRGDKVNITLHKV